MKNNKTVRAIVVFFTVGIFCICSASPFVCAILERNGTITLNVADSNTHKPLPGMSFRLYLFAAAYESGNGVGYDYVVPYDDCNMDMGNLQDAYLPIHLAHFANTHSLPYTEKTSDENGHILFDDLAPGVYLVLASESLPNYFMPSPFVVNIPLYDNENKSWVYDVNATPKMRIYGGSAENTFTYISVKKVWEEDRRHPESVTISLLCDFTQVDTVELSDENNWSFRWENLSAKHNWNVVETVPDGYKVSYEISENTVKIINRADSDTPEGSPPSDETTTEEEELIYTGQLNWPIPIFSAAGLLLFSLGWAMFNFGNKDEEAV